MLRSADRVEIDVLSRSRHGSQEICSIQVSVDAQYR